MFVLYFPDCRRTYMCILFMPVHLESRGTCLSIKTGNLKSIGVGKRQLFRVARLRNARKKAALLLYVCALVNMCTLQTAGRHRTPKAFHTTNRRFSVATRPQWTVSHFPFPTTSCKRRKIYTHIQKPTHTQTHIHAHPKRTGCLCKRR